LRLLARSSARPLADFPGSDRCCPAWLDRWQAPGFHRVLRTSCRLAADLPTCVGVPPPARPAVTSDSHLASSFSSAGLNNLRLSPSVVAGSGLRLPLLQPASLRSPVAPFCQTGGDPPTRIGCFTLRLYRFRFARTCALALHTSGWAFVTPLASTEPCIAG
jgi:hypothetical protein